MGIKHPLFLKILMQFGRMSDLSPKNINIILLKWRLKKNIQGKSSRRSPPPHHKSTTGCVCSLVFSLYVCVKRDVYLPYIRYPICVRVGERFFFFFLWNIFQREPIECQMCHPGHLNWKKKMFFLISRVSRFHVAINTGICVRLANIFIAAFVVVVLKARRA